MMQSAATIYESLSRIGWHTDREISLGCCYVRDEDLTTAAAGTVPTGAAAAAASGDLPSSSRRGPFTDTVSRR